MPVSTVVWGDTRVDFYLWKKGKRKRREGEEDDLIAQLEEFNDERKRPPTKDGLGATFIKEA